MIKVIFREPQLEAETNLNILNSELEIRVGDRTTELEASNRLLAESEENFRELAEAVPQIVWSAGPNGCFDCFN